MSLPASFSNNTSPTGVQLDQNFAATGAMGVQATVATGTNAITLTPTANQPTISAYVNNLLFTFLAVNSSNSSVTVQVNALSALPLYKAGNSQAGSGDVSNGSAYLIQYLSALNSGGGGFIILSSVPASAVAPVSQGSVQGLTVNNNSGTPSTKADIAGGRTVMVTVGGTPIFRASISLTCDLTTTGANGMDTGARPTSGWVYLYAIDNGSVTASLGSATSPTAGAPTLPGGYTYYTFVGAMWLDGSQNLFRSKQKGNHTQWTIVASTNTPNPPNIANGSAGSYSATSPTLATASVVSFVPLTAGSIMVVATNKYGAGTAASAILAPSTAWGGTNNGPSGSANTGLPWYCSSSAAVDGAEIVTFVLEGTTVAWCSNAAGGGISSFGWIDSWVRA